MTKKHGRHIQESGASGAQTGRGGVALAVAKYLLAVLLAAFVATRVGEPRYALSACIEVLGVFAVSNLCARKHRALATAVSAAGLLLIGLQCAVLLFGSTYLSTVMITNLGFIEDISGNAATYIAAAVVVAAIALLPVRHVPIRGCGVMAALLVAADLALALLAGSGYSPLYAYVHVGREMKEISQQQSAASALGNTTGHFYRDGIESGVARPASLPEKPNVVVIYTEGLSQLVIDDEREIMPNVARWQQKSLSFEGYCNHTFATLRGLIGQLYSGYQLENLDTSTLVSLQSVLGERGYRTAFINTEPNNADFTEYLRSFDFDNLVCDSVTGLNGYRSSAMSDGDAYATLWATMQEYESQRTPFFVSIYTYGTHVSLDSPGETFGDGSNAILNKFYFDDLRFGEFMEKFDASSLADNTIVVFTADHATYQDADFESTFGKQADFYHTMVNEVPFFFYYRGIEPQTIDAAGRNSLDMAPTLLDYLDVSVPNYFLGQSLFLPNDQALPLETVFCAEQRFFATDGCKLRELTEQERAAAEDEIVLYYAAKTQQPQKG